MIHPIDSFYSVPNQVSPLSLLLMAKLWTDFVPSVVLVQDSKDFYPNFVEGISDHFRLTHL